MPFNFLLVEDCEDDAELLVRELRRNGFDFSWERVQTAGEMDAALARGSWDMVISDYKLPGFHAPAALDMLKRSNLDIPFIVVSGTIGEELAVELMRAGASDYIMKGNLRRLAEVVHRELREARMRRERRQLEEQLRQSQKLESVGHLAGGVAHDFNNMLAVIIGYTEMMQLQATPEHPFRENIDQILEAAERSRDLTRQLLAFARKQTLVMRRLHLNEVILGLQKMMRRTLREDIDLRLELGSGLGAFAGDLRQVEQVLLNLALNAQDAMPLGGVLRFQTAEVALDPQGAESGAGPELKAHLKLTVEDTGMGMEESVLGKIFDPFFTTKTLGRGTGLGLSTVYGIVKQHGGHIRVRSEVEKGTAFHIYFPRRDDLEPQASSRAAEQKPPAGLETILVAEDQEQVRKLVCEVLARHGYKILEADCGQAAIARAGAHAGKLDLVVSDVVMPDMNSQILYLHLQKLRPGLKILHMSGYAEDTLGPLEVLKSELHFIQKPFLLKDFVQRVRDILDRG